ncbi:MAG: hypothetical protein H6Q68_1311 [Firmicutes bacterium]|nr:hypothetical protein [Bacillota bacterium]
MENKLSVYDMDIMNSSPTYQSDYAPELPISHSSVASNNEHENKQSIKPLSS